MSIEFLLTSIVVVMLPGTGVLYTLSIGLGQGARAGVVAAFGCTLGIVPTVLASILGLAALLHTSAVAFQVIKYLGVAYLFFMAWSMLREGGALAVSGKARKVAPGRIILDAVLLNALNPKLSLFFLAFLPQFIPAGTASPMTLLLLLAGTFMALTFVVFAGYGLCASLARSYVVSRPAVMLWLRRSFAATFGLLGIRLALASR